MSGAFISDLLARKTHPCFTYARPCHTALFHPTPRYPRPTAHCSIDPPDMHPSTLVQVHTFVAPPQHQVTSTYMFHHPRTSATASQHHLLSRRWRQVPFEGAQPVDLSRKLRHHGWLLLLPLLRYGLCRNRSNLLKRHLQVHAFTTLSASPPCKMKSSQPVCPRPSPSGFLLLLATPAHSNHDRPHDSHRCSMLAPTTSYESPRESHRCSMLGLRTT